MNEKLKELVNKKAKVHVIMNVNPHMSVFGNMEYDTMTKTFFISGNSSTACFMEDHIVEVKSNLIFVEKRTVK